MRDLAGFRQAVREHRRAIGRTQQQLARAVGLHPHVLSHKLNGHGTAILTAADVAGIVTTLAAWGALVRRTDAYALLELMALPPQTISPSAWAAPPMATLIADEAPARAAEQTPRPPDPTAQPPETRPSEVKPHRLEVAPIPVPATRLVGRAVEREATAMALAASRLVTLTGPGGTGKTRLAVQVAEDVAARFADGAGFVDLAPVRDPALIAVTIARAVGLSPPSAAAAEAELVEALRPSELLLVIDNLEHLLEETPVLGRLLVAVPGLHLLATSRIPLRLYGEHVLRVPPLGLRAHDHESAAGSDAVQLFVQRARAARADFAPDGAEVATVAAICAVLDGLPLAIELAAAAVKLYPPQALLPMLESRLAVLTGGPRDLPQRQQTLRATLDWGHALLDDDAQQLFSCLGVFAGPFDAAAAAAVHGAADGPNHMLARLADLSDHSLLELTPGSTPRFHMLETVREYASARLAETGERDQIRQRHLDHYLVVVAAGEHGTFGRLDAGRLDQVADAYPNIRAALDFARAYAQQRDGELLDEGLRLATGLVQFWQTRGSVAEGVLQLDRMLALDSQHRAVRPETRAAALLEASALACFLGDYPRAVGLAQEAIAVCEQLGDHRALSRAYRFLGEAAIDVGDDDEAERCFLQQLDESTQVGNLRGQASAYNMLGQVERHRGDYHKATALLRSALRLFGAACDREGVATALNSLGEAARDEGRAGRARRLFRAALHRHRQLGHIRGMAYDLEGLAAAAALDGDGRQALTYLGAAHTLRERNSAPLPPAEQTILTSILAPALAPLRPEDQDEALATGRNRHEKVIADALQPV
jgi:predicted ATPase